MTATRIEFYILHGRIGHRRHREARLLIQINSSQNQRDIRALISNSRRWRMYRFSLIVTAVGLLLAGSASATPRTEFRRAPQDGFWGGPLLSPRKRLGLSGPLPILDLPVVPSDRFGYLFLLWDRSPVRLLAPAVAVRTTSLLDHRYNNVRLQGGGECPAPCFHTEGEEQHA
jgi:hypothetical protein